MKFSMKFKMFRFAACIALGFVVSAAHAATLLSINHDGTSGDENNPFDTGILSQGMGTDWYYTTDGSRSVMTALDNSALSSGNNRLILVQKDNVTEFTGTPAGKGWVFEIEIKFLAGVSESATGVGFANFGVRSENEAGKAAWVGLNEKANSSTGLIYFANANTAAVSSPSAPLNVGSLIAGGKYHNFKLYKYDNKGTTTVDVYMDGLLVLTTPYSAIGDDQPAADIQGFASGTPVPSSQVNIDFINFTLYDNLIASAPPPALVLADINADGTGRTATTGDFEDAAGLAAGTFSGKTVTVFGGNEGGGAYSETNNNVTLSMSDKSGDADGWFGAGSNNNLLEDGFFLSAAGTKRITLSGSGLGLNPGRRYELYLFAGRSRDAGGHNTTFTFDVYNPNDPTRGTAILAGEPTLSPLDETLGTVKFTFDTGSSIPTTLAINWTSGGSDNEAAAFSGFALRDIGADTTPPAITTLWPTNNATGVLPDAYPVVTFYEDVVKNTTGSIIISNRTDNSITTIPIGDASQIAVSGRTLTIFPTVNLAANTPYAVLIGTNALKDAAGNFFAGIPGATNWWFETGKLLDTVAYWKFDNGALLNTSVGNPNYNLTNPGGGYVESTVELVDPIPNPDPTVGSGNNGSVYSVGNGLGYLLAGVNSSKAVKVNGNAWTFEGWIKTTDSNLDPILNARVASGRGIMFDKRADGGNTVFYMYLNDGTGSEDGIFKADFSLSLDTSYHFALTHDGSGNFELFVDGASVGTHTTALSLAGIDANMPSTLNLLGRPDDSDGSFGGRADEFRISRRVLAPSEFLSYVAPPKGTLISFQ